MASLHREAVAALGARRGGEALAASLVRTDPAASLIHDLSVPTRTLLVGCLGAAPVGYGVLDTPRPGMPAVLGELFVDPAARCVGVGSAILEAAVATAREAGCTGIDATALPGDRDTKNFFEDHAMVARAITVHRGFGDAP